jgi:hypothetical protein
LENDDSIYVCDNGNDRILVFSSNGEPKSIITFENCQHPRKLQIVENFVYVLHKSGDSSGEIFVSILDKNTQQLMNSIKQNEINVKSFFIDSSFNLIKIGQLVGNGESISPNGTNGMQYLVVSKRNGQFLFKTILNLEQIVWDFCFRYSDQENCSKIEMICATNEGILIVEF